MPFKDAAKRREYDRLRGSTEARRAADRARNKTEHRRAADRARNSTEVRLERDRVRNIERREYNNDRAKASYLADPEKAKAAMKARWLEKVSTPSGRVEVNAKLAVNRGRRLGIPVEPEIVAVLSDNPPTHCPECKKELDYSPGKGTQHGARHASPSIDRIDPPLGYVVSNVRIICFECNGKKWTYPADSWQDKYPG